MAQIKSLQTGIKFKDTPIGKIPVDWELIGLGDISEIITKGTTPTTYGHNYKDKGIVFLRVENINENGHINLSDVKYISLETHDFLNRSQLKESDLLFSIAGAIGRCAIVSSDILPSNINQAIALVRIRNKNLTDLYFILQMLMSKYIKNQIALEATSLAQANLNLEQVRNLKLPFPPLPEQKKIAEILMTVDDAIEETDRIIEKTKELKKGLMQQLLIRGIGHKKFKKTEIGEIPKEWKVVRLEEVATIERGKFQFRPRNEPRFYGGKYPFVQTGDVTNSRGSIKSYSQTLNDEGLAISKLFPKGTILITIAANIGDTAIAEFDLAFPDSLIGIITKEPLINIFLEYYLRTRKSHLNKLATKSAQKNINLETLRPYHVPIPPKQEQKKIVDVLLEVDFAIEEEELQKQHLETLKKSLMQVLLTGKVRVKLQ